jgi:hypothetical protein
MEFFLGDEDHRSFVEMKITDSTTSWQALWMVRFEDAGPLIQPIYEHTVIFQIIISVFRQIQILLEVK